MTTTEARKTLGLKENDKIREEGLRFLLGNINDQLKTWSLSANMKEKLQREKEACEKLLNA